MTVTGFSPLGAGSYVELGGAKVEWTQMVVDSSAAVDCGTHKCWMSLKSG
jgi:hypothetical protein